MVDLANVEVFQAGAIVSELRSPAPFDLSGNITGRQLTTTQINALSGPLASQMVYDTTVNLYKYYNGTAWVALDTSGSGSLDPGTIALASKSIIIGNASNVGVASAVIQVDATHTSVGINTTPDTTTYALKVTGLNGAYFAGSGSDVIVGRDVRAGQDNTGRFIGYRFTVVDTASPMLLNQGILQSIALPPMTTTQKNALSAQQAGCIVFDSTLAKLCVYNGATWETVTSS